MTRLHCRTLGSSGGPTLLLIHGLGASGEVWARLAERLAGRYRLLIPDLRGHGRSPHSDRYRVDELADDVIDILDRHGTERADVLGHSLGAMVAYRLAAKIPQRVGRLVLEEPPPPLPADPPRDAGPRPDGPLDFDWRIQDQFSAERNDPPTHWLDDLQRISAPTLVIRGLDSHIARAQVVRLVAAIPDCRLVELPAGHDVHDEAADAFGLEVDAFLAGGLNRGWS